MKSILIRIIDFYRKYLSYLKPPSCRFCPTCSQYAALALKKKGIARGLLAAVKRVLRCHPFSKGGYDPVE